MKKVLAVLLAVVLCFSFSATAFATELPSKPAVDDGKIKICVGSCYIDAGNTYELPVSIVSCYSTSVAGTADNIGMAFSVSFGVSSNDGGTMAGHVTIDSFTFNETTKALDGFFEAENFCDSSTVVSAVIPGKGIFNTDGTEIGTLKITVDDSIEFATDAEGADISIDIEAAPYAFGILGAYTPEGKFATAIDSIQTVDCAAVNADGDYEQVSEGSFVSVVAHCYATPPVIPWTERILTVLKTWAYKIISGFTAILDVAKTFLKPEGVD